MAAGKIFAISFAINATVGGSFASAMSRTSSLMTSLQTKTRAFSNEQSQLSRKIQATNGYIGTYKSRMALLSSQYTSGKISLSQYSAELQVVRQRMAETGASVTAYKERLAQLEGETNKAKAKMQELQAAQAKRQDAFGKVGTAWSNMQSTTSSVGMMSAPLVGAIETAANFEAAMSKVKAITRSNDEEMQKLNENARMLGATTQFSAIQAADAMSYLGMAGWNSSQIIAGMPGLLSLAAAGGTDLARTADIVSDDLTAFGLSADQAGHMADVFAVTVTRTNTNVEMLGETMKYAAPVAKAFGVSMEETSALAGLMANSGIKASQAGTALRSGFLRLAGPPKMAQKALAKLGVSLSDVTAQQQEAQAALESLGISMSDMNGPRKMSAILTELRDKTANLGKEEKLAQLKAIFGTEAATGWLAVLDAGPEAFDKLVHEMENCDGEAKKMADTMMNNAKGSWIQLKSAMESLAISVGSIFLPALTAAGKGAAEMVGNLAGWVSQHQALTAGILGTAGAIMGLMVGVRAYSLIKSVIIAAKAAMDVYKITLGQTRAVQMGAAAATSIHAASTAILGAAMNFVRHPIDSTRAAMAALKTQFLATRVAQLASAAATMVHAAAVSFFSRAVLMIRNPIMTALGAMQLLRNGMAAVGTAAVSAPGKIAGGFKALPGLIGSALSGLPGVLMSVASVGLPVIAVIAAIAGAALLVAANFDQIKETATIVFNHISGTVGAWVARLQAAFQTALTTITGVWNSVTGQTLSSSQMIGAIINNIGFVIGAAFDVAAGVVGTAISVIINLVAAMAQLIGGFVNIIAGFLTGDWDRAWKGAAQVFDGLFDGTIGTFKTIADGVGGIFDTLMGKADEAQKKAEEVKNASQVEGGADDTDSYAVADAQAVASATGEAAGSAQALSSNMQQAGANTEQASGSMQQLQNFMQQMPNVTQNAFANMSTDSANAAQAVTNNLQQIPTQTQATFDQIPQQAQTALQQIPQQTQGVFDQMQPMAQQSVDAIAAEYNQLAAKCQPGGDAFVQAAGQWGQSAYNSIAQWADQMASAVQNKLSSAWSNIQSQFSAGLNVNVTTTNTVVTKEVKENAKGGIYHKGAFLTTFAEEGPEAAIPLDGSKRAINLWKMAGNILGFDTSEYGESGSTPTYMPTPKIEVSRQTAGKAMATKPVVEPANTAQTEAPMVMPPINLTLNFYGEQEPKEIKSAVVDAARKAQKSFAEQMKEFQRERGRLAYE